MGGPSQRAVVVVTGRCRVWILVGSQGEAHAVHRPRDGLGGQTAKRATLHRDTALACRHGPFLVSVAALQSGDIFGMQSTRLAFVRGAFPRVLSESASVAILYL